VDVALLGSVLDGADGGHGMTLPVHHKDDVLGGVQVGVVQHRDLEPVAVVAALGGILGEELTLEAHIQPLGELLLGGAVGGVGVSLGEGAGDDGGGGAKHFELAHG
jgi:hypothetical protein